MPDDFGFTVDASGLDRDLKELADGLETFPTAGNPLLEWRATYALRTERAMAERPTVSQPGQFRGNQWDALAPAYHRETDNEDVPVWGGVERLRAGHVTRTAAFGKNIRTKAGAGAGAFGVVNKGQSYTSGPVLGKLKKDGSRYKPTDPQLGKGRPGSLLGDWRTADPQLSNGGKTITLRSSIPYAEFVHEKRPFAYGGSIDKEESEAMLGHIQDYLRKILRGWRGDH